MNPVIIGDATLYNMDCMEFLRAQADKAFDLAIVDPPYFDGPNKSNFYRNGLNSRTGAPAGQYSDIKEWAVPQKEYFSELERVSKHQIVWGVNYYENEVNAVGRIVWDKENGESSFSDAEIASCSLIKSVRMFRYRWNGMLQADMKNKEVRIHPTQKPIKLYEWLLYNYAETGQRILDTHLGSGSSAIAAKNFGVEFVACELEPSYFSGACERLRKAHEQIDIFAAVPAKQEQAALI